MRSFTLGIAALLGASACILFDDGGGHTCFLPDQTAGVALAPQRNPETLTCESTSPPCDPKCGPCPAGATFAPATTWGFCGAACESLGETQCAADPTCRVVKDARCAVSGTCATDFLGCFPTDQSADTTIACTAATDGFTCSRSPNCTALHRNDPCPTDQVCSRTFAACVAEGSAVGKCHAQITCKAAPPTCVTGTTPGVANGCFTGVCIPNDICEP